MRKKGAVKRTMTIWQRSNKETTRGPPCYFSRRVCKETSKAWQEEKETLTAARASLLLLKEHKQGKTRKERNANRTRQGKYSWENQS